MKFVFEFFTLGICSSWEEVVKKGTTVLTYIFIIIPFFGIVLFGISPAGQPLEPILMLFGKPARRMLGAGIISAGEYVESINNAVAGNGMRPGSIDDEDSTEQD